MGAAVFAIAVSSAGAASASPRDAAARTAIVAMLDASVADWNRGDLDGFMKSYEDSPRTLYVTSKTIVRGYAAIRAHYASSYRGSHTGTLSLSDFVVRSLGAGYAVVVARWHLAMRDGTHPTGLFTLALARDPGGWRIVVDHSP